MSSYSSTVLTSVFDTGKYKTKLKEVKSVSHTLLIAYPLEAGEFPLLLFLHGFELHNSYYSQLIEHIASHGFIVIAPQLYNRLARLFAGTDASNEIRSAAEITNWLSEGLSKFLPTNVTPAFGKLALAGHSQGGKVAFALALRKLDITTKLKFSALIGVDPVDGTEKERQTHPPVLTSVPHSFDFGMATSTLVIGSGLGEVKSNPFFPPGAPKGLNHVNFFNKCQKPAWYFVAKDYGHLDMLNDEAKGLTRIDPRWLFTYVACKNGKSRKPMRRFVGGVVVAFLRAYLLGDNSDLLAIRDRHESAPVEFDSDYRF